MDPMDFIEDELDNPDGTAEARCPTEYDVDEDSLSAEGPITSRSQIEVPSTQKNQGKR